MSERVTREQAEAAADLLGKAAWTVNVGVASLMAVERAEATLRAYLAQCPDAWQTGTPPVSGAYWLRDVADDGSLYAPEVCTITLGTDGLGHVTHLGSAALYPLRAKAQWIGPLPVPDYAILGEKEGGAPC